MRYKIVAAAILMLVLSCLVGCIFEPRTAEDPGGDEENTWIVPRVPKDVFLNLASGLAAAANSNYERSLDTDFTFIPRAQDLNSFPAGTFDSWTKDVELQVLNRIKGEYQGERKVQFGDENGTFPREDVLVGEAIFEGPYLITLKRGDGTEDIYGGTAEFHIKETSQGWAIVLWKDIDISGTYPTSGNLRGSYRGS